MGINDTVKLSKFIKILKYYGFSQYSQRGSHIKFKRNDIPRPLIIPARGKRINEHRKHFPNGKEIPFYSELEKFLKDI